MREITTSNSISVNASGFRGGVCNIGSDLSKNK
jgi:hypothetical protein